MFSCVDRKANATLYQREEGFASMLFERHNHSLHENLKVLQESDVPLGIIEVDACFIWDSSAPKHDRSSTRNAFKLENTISAHHIGGMLLLVLCVSLTSLLFHKVLIISKLGLRRRGKV